jgi:ABC-type histidine transport system ATPase subunit
LLAAAQQFLGQPSNLRAPGCRITLPGGALGRAGGEILEVMRPLAEEGMTMLAITHNTRAARQAGTRVLFKGRGRILEEAV